MGMRKPFFRLILLLSVQDFGGNRRNGEMVGEMVDVD